MTIAPAKALLLTLTTAVTLAAYGARAAHAADVFTLESTTFKDGQLLPKPVFVVSDPDAGLGAGITHWVAYGISPETTSFAEGEASQPSGKYVAGKSTKNIPGFGGPCPPPGSPHHYLFQIVATDLDPKDLPPGLTIAELQEKLKGHRKGESSLVGTYVNPYPQ
jgi:Raf kinase inhibitor-like YbhB/YbcL family protein